MFILLFLAIVLSPYARANNDANLADFEKHEIVPDVVAQAPKELAKVTYDSEVRAATGNELTPTQVKNQPSVEWSAESDALYTLMFIDPDAPSRAEPKFRHFKHWLVVNIPGADVARGDVLTAYIGSGPPQGTGLHRYVFLIYKQNGKIDVSKETPVANNSRRNRPKFNAAEFIEEHNLGVPVAGNFYQAQYDDYVPLLHKQLSEN